MKPNGGRKRKNDKRMEGRANDRSGRERKDKKRKERKGR